MRNPRAKNPIKLQIGEKKTRRLFLLPRDRAEGIVLLLQDFEVKDQEKTIPWRDAVSDLVQKYTEAGVVFKGARVKESFSQRELAANRGNPQSCVFEMKHGRQVMRRDFERGLQGVSLVW
jgi:hypothetical protein